ncbi:MAG TPA: hypothetical protein VNU92_09760 [Edaphobacter sp.]|jgi:hypothetical protein|nr:hypothetical protein [Edaphobacter sp.]
MLLRTASLFAALILFASDSFALQNVPLEQRVTELKESVAANGAKLQKYQWTETATTLVKGETRKTEQFLCQYGPDGKVQKTLQGTPPAPPEEPHGLRGKIVAKKVGEMKDYGERLKSLIGEYVPPSQDSIQTVFQAGNATTFSTPGGIPSVILNNYYKSGDKVTFDFDPSTKQIRSFTVNTYLDNPKSDVVILTVSFATLPDGSNHVASTDLQAESKEIEIKSENTDYHIVTK